MLLFARWRSGSLSAWPSIAPAIEKHISKSDARPPPRRRERAAHIALSPRRLTRLARAGPRARRPNPKHFAGCTCHHGSLRAAPSAPRARAAARKQKRLPRRALLLGRTEERRTGREDELGRPRRPGPHLHESVWRAGLALGRRVQERRLAQNERHPVDGARLDRPGDEG